MNFPEFDKFQSELHGALQSMSNTKGREYAHSEDRFANFRRIATDLNSDELFVAYVYFKKHLDAIISYIVNKETYSGEHIQGRFLDAILYLELIAGMVSEKEK